jgi:putative nucleotidyltransferase with HDIG domain
MSPPTKVFVVDDEPMVSSVLCRYLAGEGFECRSSDEAPEALKAVETEAFDLVITDIDMPERDGVWLLKEIKARFPDLPVLMLTGLSTVQAAIHCLRIGADDYLRKPVDFSELLTASQRALEKCRLVRENRQYQRELEKRVEERTASLNQALREIQATYQTTLEALAAALDARERETGFHSQRVMRFTVALARRLGVQKSRMEGIARGALLHDIGKIGVPDSILLKPGKLTEDEWVEMRKHPELGYRILKRIPFLEEAREIVLSHQERWDGKGYPRGLSGEQIVLGARIFAVVDTLDAMTSDRCYRRALPYRAAREEITRCSGTQFDPLVVDAFLSIPEEDWTRMRRQVSAEEGRPGVEVVACPREPQGLYETDGT